MSSVKAFFEQNPRSLDLRNKCLQGTRVCDHILTVGKDSQLVGELMDVNAGLVKLGITPNMHVADRQDTDRAQKLQKIRHDPVTQVEWVAGQLVAVMGDILTGQDIDTHVLAEHDELHSPHDSGLFIIDTPATAPSVQDWLLQRGIIGMLNSYIDAEAGPSHAR